MFRGSYTAGSVAFLLLSTTPPAFCLRIFPRNARKRRGGRIALAPASCIQNRPGFHHGNRGGSFALWVLFSGAHTKPCEGSFGKPRVCGEKILCFFHGLGLPGSPPRVRGKGHLTLAVSHMHRINPAYTGKSTLPHHRAHFAMGSPPRMRGKALTESETAAYCRDHPRICGEKTKKIP